MSWFSIVVFCFFSSVAFAADEAVVHLKDAKAIEADIDMIKELTPEAYYNQVDSLRESIERFLVAKKKVCLGEYAPYILSSGGDEKLPNKTKLEDKEKRQCFKDLRKMHSNYIENMYSARKGYLESSHKKRLEELARFRDQALTEIKKAYSN